MDELILANVQKSGEAESPPPPQHVKRLHEVTPQSKFTESSSSRTTSAGSLINTVLRFIWGQSDDRKKS